MNVEVCYASPENATRVSVAVEAGSTVAEAVERSGLVEALALDATTLAFAVFGRRAAPDTVLAPGDRVELLRPLRVDPKDARRRRAEKKSRAAGACQVTERSTGSLDPVAD